MRTIGIDIGSYSIKVAEIDSNLKRARLRDFIEIELNHEPGHDLRLEKLEILRRISTQYDPKVYKIALAVGAENCTHRVMHFPFSDRRKILQSLPFELEDVIPFSQEDAIFDFRIIQKKQDSAQILAVAVPKKHIQELLILCEDAGIDPDIISSDGVALGNMFENCLLPPPVVGEDFVENKNASLVAHIGYNQTIINVVKDNKLFATRAIYFGGRDLADLISRSYSIPYLEALKGVSEKGFVLTHAEGADADQLQFSELVSQGLEKLIMDLKRTIVDLRSEHEFHIDQIYLMGGMSRLMNLGPYLTQHLEIPCNVKEHLGHVTQVDISSDESTDKGSAVSVGLALEALRRPKAPPLNFRKQEFSKQSQDLKIFWERYQAPIKMASLLFVVFFVYTSYKLSLVEDNLRQVNKAIRTLGKPLNLPKSQQNARGIRKFAKNKQKEITSKKQILKLRELESPLGIMKTISSAVPSKEQITLDIRKFHLKNDTLAIQGLVDSKGQLTSLRNSLSRIANFSNIKKAPIVISAPAGKTAFHYTMSVARQPQVAKGKKK